MPRIDNALLDCAVYLYAAMEDAQRGTAAGGCGFLLGVPSNAAEPLVPSRFKDALVSYIGTPHPNDVWSGGGEPFIYVVTNRHIVDDGFTVVRLNTQDGKSSAVQLSSWFFHPMSDLAISPIECASMFNYMAVSYNYLLSEENAEALDVGVGDDAVSVSRFINHEGRQRNRPVVRFGQISMMPDERDPVAFRYRSKADKSAVQRPQVSFLIESRTIPGYSGSPVFLRIPAWELRESHHYRLRHALHKQLSEEIGFSVFQLLGVTWGFLLSRNETR